MNAEIFAAKFAESFQRLGTRHIDAFLERVPGDQIADIGCGPGVHAEYMRERGKRVICLDNSKAMIELCRGKGLEAIEMDLENLMLGTESCDGVWAMASLLHLPKEQVPGAIDGIRRILKPGGVVGVGVKEGTQQGFEKVKYADNGSARWFSYFSDEEVKALFQKQFVLEWSDANHVKPGLTFLDYVFRKSS